jgi:hypothetical protein
LQVQPADVAWETLLMRSGIEIPLTLREQGNMAVPVMQSRNSAK